MPCVSLIVKYTSSVPCSLDMTVLPSPAAVEGIAIRTSSNAAYEMIKQDREPEEGYEPITGPLRGSPAANHEGMFVVPSPPPSLDPLPAIATPAEEEEIVYEIIPGDK